MDQATKNMLFSGSELNSLQNFCDNCAQEDKALHPNQPPPQTQKPTTNPAPKKPQPKPIMDASNDKKPTITPMEPKPQPSNSFANRLAMFSGGNKNNNPPPKPKYTPPLNKPKVKVGEPKPEPKKKVEEVTESKPLPKNYVKAEKVSDNYNPYAYKPMEEKRLAEEKEMLKDFKGLFGEYEDDEGAFGW